MAKVKEKHLIWADQNFRKWWEKYGSMNPGIDPRTLSRLSYKRLNYINEDGEPDTIELKQLYRDFYRKSYRKENMVWNYPKFREWWGRFGCLNPGIDPEKLSKLSGQRLNYIDEDGIQRSEPCNIISHRLGMIKKRRLKDPAWNDEKFRATFLSELNPNVDLTKISMHDTYTRLRYYGDSGEIRTTVAMTWFAQERKAKKIKKETDPKLFCWNYPEFREFFSPELNPELDPESLKIYDPRPIKYITAAGNIDKVGIVNLFRGSNDSNPFRYPVNSQMTRLPERARHDEKFRAYYLGDGTDEEEDLSHITNASKRVNFMCPKGHRFKILIKTFYINYDEPCPLCRGQRVNLETDSAAAMDPELELFLNDDCDLSKMSFHDRNRAVRFKCPFCGYKFQRTLSCIAGKHPKCPACKDMGTTESISDDYMEIDVPYLSRV